MSDRPLGQLIGQFGPMGIPVDPPCLLLLNINAADKRRLAADASECALAVSEREFPLAIVFFAGAPEFSVRHVLSFMSRHDAERRMFLLLGPAEQYNRLALDLGRMDHGMGGSLRMPDKHGVGDRAAEDSFFIIEILDDTLSRPAGGGIPGLDDSRAYLTNEGRASSSCFYVESIVLPPAPSAVQFHDGKTLAGELHGCFRGKMTDY